ncbi:ALPHA-KETOGLUTARATE-DEPENDENT DIOXYGENASE ALKB [Salix koriyanagi]|uniref:ALPHA-KETOGLUTARATE-DEPENDENT DIOXYGENASE ALKB n=1 Tax=Salix koriyanagi TaxID=2511006 RepID=A0A9Q0SZ31_9ROSI|nr:ALPHA-KETOGLUTARATE-DEPENDENT DIOXYGENASE ALKB [Salix koriyanagi]
MYGSDKAVTDDTDRTEFRKTEKKYKLYYDQNSKRKKQPKQVDLSEVLDFKSFLDSYHQNGELPPEIVVVDCRFDRPVFGLESRPGFYFIPGALSVDEQCRWIRDSLVSFPQPPNRTNHNAIYGPISDLFAAVKERKVLVEDENMPAGLDSGSNGCVGNEDTCRWSFCEEDSVLSRGRSCKSVSASVLLRKLRWSTLGLQFDWSKRNYNVSLFHITRSLMNSVSWQKKLAAPAMPMGEEFQPEAAIVNYFCISLPAEIGGKLVTPDLP